MIWLIGEIVIVLFTALMFWSANNTEDAKAHYQGAIMFGEVMAFVIGLILTVAWSGIYIAVHFLHHPLSKVLFG